MKFFKLITALILYTICFNTYSYDVNRINFNSNWKFTKSNKTRLVDVPHDWSIQQEYTKDEDWQMGYLPVGKAVYSKNFSYNHAWKGKKIFIDFEGVYCNSTVYINGHKLGFYPNGYLGFSYEISDYLKDNNEIKVHVDAPRYSARWYAGSGIYRSVWLREEAKSHFLKYPLKYSSSELSKSKANLKFDVELERKSVDLKVKINLYHDSKLVFEQKKKVRGNKITFKTILNNPKFWSTVKPNVYEVEIELYKAGKLIDKEREIVGIRKLEFSSKFGFKLNGKKTLIKGVCDHHTAGLFGSAVPDEIILKRLRQLKNMGCNAIRTSHNPFSNSFYTICDTLGILVMDELLDGWDKPKANNDYGLHFKDWWAKDVETWIKRDRNHPCIFMYSIGNEVWGGKLAVQTKLINKVKEFDNTRPVTQGGHSPSRKNTQNNEEFVLDVRGFNGSAEYKGYLEKFHKNHSSVACIGTEVPHTYQTRGVYRTKTHWRVKDFPAPWEYSKNGNIGNLLDKVWPIEDLTDMEFFPEEVSTHYFKNGKSYPIELNKEYVKTLYYQSSYDNATVRCTARKGWQLVKDLDFFMGHFRWGSFDYLGETNKWPSRFANFGIIDICGFPKDHYYLYQSLWSSKPMVHILPHWTHKGKEGKIVPVVVYTNCDKVELFLNGKSLGVKEYDGEQLVWKIAYKPGELKAVASTGKVKVEQVLKTAGVPKKLNVSKEVIKQSNSESNLIYCEIEVVDSNGVFVPMADNMINIKFPKDVELIGSDNGDPLDLSSYGNDYRRAFRGKALFVLRCRGEVDLEEIKFTLN
jgi:beta-galactosidase